MKLISESGLYALIFKSRKSQAKAFRRWVTHEVLPSIRRTGSYAMVPAKKEKLVTVDHRYTRNSPLANPHGIQYRLDLTRIVAKPNRHSLEILTRLTGVDFSDIDLSQDEGQTDLHLRATAFLAAGCELDPMAREGSTRLYQAFTLWWQDQGLRSQYLPSHRAFSLCLKDRRDLAQKRVGDGVYWHGLRLTEEWRARIEAMAVAV